MGKQPKQGAEMNIDNLEKLARAATTDPVYASDLCKLEDFHDAISPDVVTALIDRVRELEGENAAFRKGLGRIAKYPQKPGDELSYTYCRLIARAALERSETLNKE